VKSADDDDGLVPMCLPWQAAMKMALAIPLAAPLVAALVTPLASPLPSPQASKWLLFRSAAVAARLRAAFV
jgi:hypothetical protein